jgi:thiamine biosynthesis protein ThiS
MKINIYNEKTNETKQLELPEKATITTLLQHININPVEVVIAQNNNVVPEKTPLKDGDNIKIFSVVSGG